MSDSEDLLSPARAAAPKRSTSISAGTSRAGGLNIDKLLRDNKKRKENIAKGEEAAAEIERRNGEREREKEEQAAAAAAAAAAPRTPSGGGGGGKSDERAARLFTKPPRVPAPPRFEAGGSAAWEDGVAAGEVAAGEEMLRRLEGRAPSDPEAEELLLGGWIGSRFGRRAEPTGAADGGGGAAASAELLRWLFFTTCFDADADRCAAASTALGSLLQCAAPRWVPSPDDVASALVLWGADPDALGGGGLEEGAEALLGGAGGAGEASEADLRLNLLALLDALPFATPHWRTQLLSSQDWALALLWRLLVEPHAAPALPALRTPSAR
ncbi:hypothetical protein EMIHUDRAFT_441514 [Emiliania huxleyi CCMP1516]|uniref:IBB domain-containing protein n=2 Tax=Emiliania huxleyi TaxID=2903 RepID=A0A0D3JRB2_EMIH1|nr:hypothetical protein EMIHUDRAFT_443504 [Emiliania huxleyi CCMP1516]XP_005786124.1 hypothetical protein EMIHUDRAFT_441514 [Emiliania huxleyi CCMP1516]EOD26047.1 hypothetical protein EMIHUDRAFT_443504 [Emiliania huxleyi CCMP1516]EOD33695.1 hypothetical protein EMIHUDRAFT_441514 [Emiliania huxleyi CCMP1516]|eukprot:XP_005778476.1 hypothetical protein EMIHUDRAFT_443504 [Emiliania huxleyi CCMP1516]